MVLADKLALFVFASKKPDAKEELADINTELKELRAKVRMCNNILTDSERINERYNEVQRLEKEAMTPKNIRKKIKIKNQYLY